MRLLLDEHLPTGLAEQLRAQGFDCETIATWRDGAHLGARDPRILEIAAVEGRILVTYDVRTIRPLLRQWAELGVRHAGVIFVGARTARPTDIGRLLRGLLALLEDSNPEDWKDSYRFLKTT